MLDIIEGVLRMLKVRRKRSIPVWRVEHKFLLIRSPAPLRNLPIDLCSK